MSGGRGDAMRGRWGGRLPQAVVRAGLRVGEALGVLAPILGLVVFAVADFKPTVTLYVVVAGLALVLRHGLDQARLSFEIREMARRHWDGFHAH